MSYRKIYFLLMVMAIIGCFATLWYLDQPGFGAKHRMSTLLVTAFVMVGLTRRFFMGLRDDD